MFQPSAPFLGKVMEFRREIKLPLIHAAGIRDVATARHAIREGIIDLVGMTRAHIADPHIVNKIMRNEEERIRPCVGASYCLYKKVNCIHNAASGRETSLNHIVERASRSLKAAVIGGGPAPSADIQSFSSKQEPNWAGNCSSPLQRWSGGTSSASSTGV
jgi:tRNA-dihydrouridine synthase